MSSIVLYMSLFLSVEFSDSYRGFLLRLNVVLDFSCSELKPS